MKAELLVENEHGFSYDPLVYSNAVRWLKEIGKWDYVSTHGQSTDGWSIIQTANVLWEQQNNP